MSGGTGRGYADGTKDVGGCSNLTFSMGERPAGGAGEAAQAWIPQSSIAAQYTLADPRLHHVQAKVQVEVADHGDGRILLETRVQQRSSPGDEHLSLFQGDEPHLATLGGGRSSMWTSCGGRCAVQVTVTRDQGGRCMAHLRPRWARRSGYRPWEENAEILKAGMPQVCAEHNLTLGPFKWELERVGRRVSPCSLEEGMQGNSAAWRPQMGTRRRGVASMMDLSNSRPYRFWPAEEIWGTASVVAVR